MYWFPTMIDKLHKYDSDSVYCSTDCSKVIGFLGIYCLLALQCLVLYSSILHGFGNFITSIVKTQVEHSDIQRYICLLSSYSLAALNVMISLSMLGQDSKLHNSDEFIVRLVSHQLLLFLSVASFKCVSTKMKNNKNSTMTMSLAINCVTWSGLFNLLSIGLIWLCDYIFDIDLYQTCLLIDFLQVACYSIIATNYNLWTNTITNTINLDIDNKSKC